MGWNTRCCAEDPPPCYLCNADADTVSVTLAGLSNGDCVCSGLNTTHILSRIPADACSWRKYASLVNCGGWYGLVSYSLVASVGTGFMGRPEWTVNLRVSGGLPLQELAYVSWRWNSSNSDPIDCTAARTLTQIAIPAGAVCSDWGSMTCQVN